ncbi:exosortase C-terminal domain/associated protein EpsI [Duganella aceris]|uniref:EpsI family protein n=1 Tax=Duganella aceris TaxID=2703883 RepID=A0ABX0FU96_9BURK|nr:exosortase C-terminal domain/associated protein EpsI [Duganella aceris]NGZ88034.1 EpsI family protein [Duganella aceris]
MKLNLPPLPLKACVLAAALLSAAALGAVLAKPVLVSVDNAPDLEATVPKAFGDWKLVPSLRPPVITSTSDEPNIDQPYDQTVMRSYANSKGEVVMLALAWGRRQQQEVKVHRPDLCYVAQGYKVRSLAPAAFSLTGASGQRASGKHMVAVTDGNVEAVSYWIRIGSMYSENAFETRMHILKEGFQGKIPDGILVRASQSMRDPNDVPQAWPVLDRFLVDLAQAVPASTRAMLLR